MKLVAALLGALLVAALAVAVYMRRLEHEPAIWHVDPTVATRTGKPNDYLVAPEGATAAAPDLVSPVYAVPPGELLSRFDAVAADAARTDRIGGSVEGRRITYVQRSRHFGFPDYVTVEAVEAPGGSALIIWSRSRFGYGDFGVNRARVEDWLVRMGTPGG